MSKPTGNRIAYWADRIAKVWQDSVEGILDAGRTLIDARAEFKQQERPFSDLIGDKDGKPSQLPFQYRAAYKLIAIAEDDKILSHATVLPPSWETLYALHALSVARFDELVESGVINPGMRRADIKAAEKAEKIERRTIRERELGEEQIAYPTKLYGLILADDEWDQQVRSRETGMDRHAATHYETAADAHTPEELHERTKLRFTPAPDCLLCMWTTNQHLGIAMELMKLRGFNYVSNYCWGKDKIGLGFWNREKHELLLLGTRGHVPCPAPGQQWDSLIMAPRGEHSEKPECFLEMLEQYFPTLPKIEINRRGPPRPGWDAWGNEVELPEIEPNEINDIQTVHVKQEHARAS
jgi:N6-adenosine-specific RNA methylase IME4